MVKSCIISVVAWAAWGWFVDHSGIIAPVDDDRAAATTVAAGSSSQHQRGATIFDTRI